MEYASAYNENHPEAKVDYFVFGHLHVLMDRPLADGARVVVLGDWISRFSYAVWDGKELTTHIYEDKI